MKTMFPTLTMAVALMMVVGAACARRPAGTIILCAGDSITEHGYPRFLSRMLRSEGKTVRVINEGKSGNTSGEYLAFMRRELPRLKAVRPDVVLLQLGTNDIRMDGDHTPLEAFERNMMAILDLFAEFRSRSGRPPTIFLGTIPHVPEGTSWPFTSESGPRVEGEINPALRALAVERGLTLVDNHAVFAERPELLRPADVHPTPEGDRALAASWHAALAAGSY
jgi:lysophospholipase L1-like esterase